MSLIPLCLAIIPQIKPITPNPIIKILEFSILGNLLFIWIPHAKGSIRAP